MSIPFFKRYRSKEKLYFVISYYKKLFICFLIFLFADFVITVPSPLITCYGIPDITCLAVRRFYHILPVDCRVTVVCADSWDTFDIIYCGIDYPEYENGRKGKISGNQNIPLAMEIHILPFQDTDCTFLN